MRSKVVLKEKCPPPIYLPIHPDARLTDARKASPGGRSRHHPQPLNPSQPMPTTLVFDWGDTLMQVFPQFTGAMARLARVAAVPGAPEGPRSFSTHYNLVVATNAADSILPGGAPGPGSGGDLSRFFSAVFTSAEYSSRKTRSGFFPGQSRSALGLQPDQLCMVGDSYS